jgi:hypothetical protein
MDETTTIAPTDGGVEASTQPAVVDTQAAAQTQEPVAQSQPAGTDDTAAWLQSKGVDPNDPEAFQKIASMAYNSEKQMTKATQEASQLRRSLGGEESILPPQSGIDPMMQEFIQDYRRDKQINSFKESHPDWSNHESAMVNILSETTPNGYTYRQLVNAGFMSLEAVYTMAKAAVPVNTDQIKEQTRQETLQALANTQRAGGGTAHASNSNPQAPSVDPIMEGIKLSRGA